MLFEVGKPHGHALVEAPLTITPKLLRVTPNVGNLYGQVVYLRAPGITKADETSAWMVRSLRGW